MLTTMTWKFRSSDILFMLSRFEGSLLDIESLSFILFLLGSLIECKCTDHTKHLFSDESFQVICCPTLSNSWNLIIWFMWPGTIAIKSNVFNKFTKKVQMYYYYFFFPWDWVFSDRFLLVWCLVYCSL